MAAKRPTRAKGSRLLEAFLTNNNVTLTSAAKALGISTPTLHDYVRGTKRPKAATASRIERWSNGDVPASAWLTSRERRDVETQKPFAATGTDG